MKLRIAALLLVCAGTAAAQTQIPGACANPDLGSVSDAGERETRRQQHLLCLEEQSRSASAVADTLGRSSQPGSPGSGDPARSTDRGYSGGGFSTSPYGGGLGAGSGGGYSSGYSTDTLRR